MSQENAIMNQTNTTSDRGGALHILNGQHAGAIVKLDSRETLSIGADVDNDVILADGTVLSQHALLKRVPTGWHMCSGESVVLQDGTRTEPGAWFAAEGALRLGNIWLALVPAGASPPDMATLACVAPSAEPPTGEGTPLVGMSTAEIGGAQIGNEPTDAQSVVSTTHSGVRWKRLSLLLAPTLLLPAGLLLGMTQRPGDAPNTARTEILKPTLDPGLAKVMLDTRWRGLKAMPRDDGRAVISGWLPDEASLDSLSMQLTRIKPRPVVRVRTDDGTREAVRTLVTELSPGLYSEYTRNGHVVLAGTALDEQSVNDVADRLKKQIPELNVVVGEIVYLPIVVERLQKEIELRKIPDILVKWDGNQVRLSGTVSPSSETVLQEVLREFDRRYHSAIPFEANLTRELGRYGTGLPFAIRSVVGGASPYIVLGDGTLLMPGGTYAGWRLKDVDATNLTFDAPQLLVVKR